MRPIISRGASKLTWTCSYWKKKHSSLITNLKTRSVGYLLALGYRTQCFWTRVPEIRLKPTKEVTFHFPSLLLLFRSYFKFRIVPWKNNQMACMIRWRFWFPIGPSNGPHRIFENFHYFFLALLNMLNYLRAILVKLFSNCLTRFFCCFL